MRFDGTLAKWNDDRGFGFIVPAQGGQEIFVHISSFPRDGRRPQLHEALSFELELNQKEQKRAVRVHRPTTSHLGMRGSAQSRPPRQAKSGFSKWVVIALLVAVGGYGYTQYAKRVSAYAPADSGESLVRPAALLPQTILTNYRCDGRQHCSQMTSCAEATFYLKNCPGVKMDGDRDGVPCEEQLCTSPFAN